MGGACAAHGKRLIAKQREYFRIRNYIETIDAIVVDNPLRQYRSIR